MGLLERFNDIFLHLAPFGIGQEVDHVDIVANIVGGELVEGEAAEIGHLVAAEFLLQTLLFNLLEHQMLVEVVNVGIQYHMRSLA